MRATLRQFCTVAILLVTLSMLSLNAFGICTRSAPGLQVTPMTSPSGSAGRVETYQVQVTDLDSSECGATSFFAVGTAPDQTWSLVFVTGNFSLSPGQTGTTNLQVTSPTGLANGSYPITVRGLNYANYLLETDVTVQYVIAPTPIPDFSLNASPTSLTIHQGLSKTTTVSITPILGFSSSVSLSASGLPVGITPSFSPSAISGSATSTLTFNVASTVAPGNYTATITGTSGTLVHSTTVSVTVDLPPQLSTITVTPPNPTVGLGSTVQFHATGTYVDNSTQDLTNNVVWSSSNTTIADIASGGLATGRAAGNTTITATLSAVSGNTQLTVGSSAGCVHSNPTVTIDPSQSPQGRAGRLESFTVKITNNDSYDCTNGTFLLYGTAPLDPHTSQPETGWSIAFVTTSFSLAPGASGTTQMQVTSPANEPDGVYDITATAVYWPIYTNAGSAKTKYLVNAVPSDFSISSNPTALTVPIATSQPVTVTSAITGNFSSDVTLSVSGLPSGVTASFDNSTIAAPGSGSAQLTFTAAANAPLGTTTVTITGTAGTTTHSTPLSLTVSGAAATLTGITVGPSNIYLTVGNTQQYRATGTYSDNSTQDITTQVAWSSSQPGIATVDGTGKATAVSPGSTSIMATLQNVTGSAGLTVNAGGGDVCTPTSPGLDVSPLVSSSGSAGRLVKYQVTITDRDNPPCDLEGTHSFLLTVTAPTGWTAVFVSSWFSLLPGDSATTELQVTSPAGTPDGNYDIVVNGLNYHVFRQNSLTATYVIGTASTPDFTIAVSPGSIPVQQGNSASVGVTTQAVGGFNSSIALSATGLPSGVTATFAPSTIGAPGSGTSSLTFTAAANATIGTFTVTVTGTGGSLTHNTTLSLQVNPGGSVTLSKIDISPANPSVMVGNNQQFSATGTYSDNSTLDVTSQVAWTSSDQTIATIDSTGLAKTLKEGSTTIGAALSAVTATTTLTVTPLVTGCFHANPQVVVNPMQASGPAGRTETYVVSVTNMDTSDCAASKFLVSATPVDPSPANGWNITTDVPSVTLAPGATGNVNLYVTSQPTLNNGSWPLSVTVANWPIFTYAGTATIQYITAPDFAISLSQGTLTIDQGTNANVTVNLLSSGGFNGPVALTISGFGTGGSGSFNPATISSGTSTLTLNATNSATPGTYNLSITGTSGALTHTIPLVLTVRLVVPVLQSISITPSNFSTIVGSNVQYHATGNYSNSTTQDLTTQATWASSATAIASISATGLVNALSAGSTTISATFNGIKGSTALTVTSSGGGGGGGGSCVQANPTVTISPAVSDAGPAGRLVRYTVTVTDNDSSTCTATQFLLTTNNTPPPPGFSAILTALQMTLSPGGQGTATLQVISPTPLASGNYVVTVTALNSGAYSYRQSATATYVVQ